MALVLTGSTSDHEWDEAGYEGLLRVQRELGARVAYTEDVVGEDRQEELLRRYAREGFDFVVGHGQEFAPAAEKVADEFPHTAFAVVSQHAGNNRNLGALMMRVDECYFVAGFIAALGTREGKVAYVGGQPYPGAREAAEFFASGVHSASPHAEVAVRWTNSWTDEAKARAVARELIAGGFDVLVPDVGKLSAAVLEEVRGARVRAVGMQKDQHPWASDAIITSVLVHIDELLVRGATLVQKGRWEGRLYQFGFAEGVLEVAPFRGSLPPEQVARVERLREDIIRGRVDLRRPPGGARRP